MKFLSWNSKRITKFLSDDSWLPFLFNSSLRNCLLFLSWTHLCLIVPQETVCYSLPDAFVFNSSSRNCQLFLSWTHLYLTVPQGLSAVPCQMHLSFTVPKGTTWCSLTDAFVFYSSFKELYVVPEMGRKDLHSWRSKGMTWSLSLRVCT